MRNKNNLLVKSQIIILAYMTVIQQLTVLDL